MAIIREQLANKDALAAWLQANAVPSLFKSVTYESSVIECYDDNDNLVLKIDNIGGIYAYRAENNAITMIPDFTGIGANEIDLIACDNGFIIENLYYTGKTGKIILMVSKTNNGVPAVIFAYQYNNKTTPYYTAIRHVAFGDSETLATNTTFAPESGQQTNFCTFCTNADIEDVSYTPKAFYLPMHSAYNSGIGKFLSGGKVYITNGYWAIDTEQSEDE